MNNLQSELIKEIEFYNTKKHLISEINIWDKESDYNKNKNLIKDELNKKEHLFLHEKTYYRNLIFFSKSENVIDEIDLEIVFCNGNKKLIDIWKYFKIMTSSAVTGDNGFGSIKMMLKDKNTEKYLGIIEIGFDIWTCMCRDDFIGWTAKNKKEQVEIAFNNKKNRLAHIINITCCVGLQPMSHNLNIGKLLVMTVFSKEVLDYFYNLRGHYYAGVSTFGLYGKSVQYDRLKEIKYIGETKGTGTSDFPVIMYEKIKDFVKKFYPNDYIKCSNMSSSKMRILQFGLNQLDFNQKEILFHGKKRGIYFGYTSNQSQDFFKGLVDKFELNNSIKPFSEILYFWKNRWAKPRLNHLLNTNRFKVSFELKDMTIKEKKNEYAKQYKFEKLDDIIWLKHKKEKNKLYYLENKDKILEELKIQLEDYKIDDRFIDPEYLAGFFDSDGSIYISKDVLFINFSQCVLNVLLLIQNQYGGSIFKRTKRNENQRDQYTLRIVGLECEKILYDLSKTSILKVEKIKKGILFLEFINKKNSSEKETIISFIRNNNKLDDSNYFNRINWKYISGFFDGDGYIGLNYRDLDMDRISPRFSISQKYTPNFMIYLRNFLEKEVQNNFGISKFEIYSSSRDNIRFIYEKIKNVIIVKKFQFENMIKILDESVKNKSLRDYEKIKKWAYDIKNNKHQDIDYSLNIKDKNIISCMKKNILENIESSINSELHKETYTKMIQSENKKGLKNPNYGHSLSNNHALNISLSTTISKRSKNPNLTNEKIREIYELKGIIMQKEASEKYGMNREMIRRIWARELIPTDDPDFKNNKIELVSKKEELNNDISANQKTSVGKRTLLIDDYIEILNWKIKRDENDLLDGKKISSTKLSEHLSKILDKKITNDMIKNTWSGRTKLFDFDFKDKNFSYENYLKVIDK